MSPLRRRGLVVRSLVLAAALPLAACTLLPPGCHDAVVSRLYLGRNSPHGEVSDAAWDAFVAITVTPRFPDGFTVFDARGHWRGDDGQTAQEATRVIEVVHDDSAAARAGVDAIGTDYRRRFAQDAVLVTHAPVRSCLQRSAPKAADPSLAAR